MNKSPSHWAFSALLFFHSERIFCSAVGSDTDSTQMRKLIIAAAVLLLSVTGTLGDVTIRGPLHDAMLAGLKEYPSIRKVTVDRPYHSITRQYRKPSLCTWEMHASIIGDYAVDKTMMILAPADCSQYTAAQWADMVPCVFTRDDMTTRCKGPLPDNAHNIKWTVGYVVIDPDNMSLPRKPAAVPKNIPFVPFVAEPTILSMVGLGLAKTIQLSARYSGSCVVRASGFKDTKYYMCNSKSLQFWLELRMPMPEGEIDREMTVSWTAWPENDRLVVDMHASWVNETLTDPEIEDYDLLLNRRKRSLVSPVLDVASSTVLNVASSTATLILKAALKSLRDTAQMKARVDAIGAQIQDQIDIISKINNDTDAPEIKSVTPTPHTIADELPAKPQVITANATVGYSRNDLGASSVTVNGKIYKLTYDPSFKIISLEPRLCPELSLSVACSIMSDVQSDETRGPGIGGNVTSFFLRSLTKCRRGGQDYVCTKGNVIGPTGLLVGVQYKAEVLDSNDAAWMELPIESLAGCAQRVYRMTDCKPPQELRSFSGLQSAEKRGVIHAF